MATDTGAIELFSGTYRPGPASVALPRSEVDRHSARSPLRSKCSSTFAPIVDRPSTWYSLNVPSGASRKRSVSSGPRPLFL